MLENKIGEELGKLGIEEDEIKRAEGILIKYSTINRDFTAKMYDDKDLRRAMKSKKLWNDKDFGLEMNERYLGEGKCEVIRQKLWVKGDKIRVYFDVKVDGKFQSAGHYVEVRKK